MLVWVAADIILPDLGFSRDAMQVAVDIGGARLPGWGLLPLICVLLIAARAGLGADKGQRLASAWLGACNVLKWIAGPTMALLLLRLLSLWNPVGALLPWLGLTWSPHASIALALVPFLGARDRSMAIRRRTAAVLFAISLAVYGGYTLYVCQMVMMHGDEAQYLRVTQSLLQDGDIDLANNLDGDITVFHVLDVGVHKAPGSPADKLYSKHPVGLSVMLMPAYSLGLRLWANPRLGAALTMAVCAAAILALLFLWLCHIGFPHALSQWVTVGCATTAPLALFSTQIYPELPAVLVTLILLLRVDPRWLLPTSGATSVAGATSVWELGSLTLMVGTLPFLHPRYAPLAALLGLGLLWQARGSAGYRGMGAVAAGGGICLAALVAHNLSFSGDWLGNFRPGSAWDTDALSPGTWLMSMPGHWIHATKGLALNAPWFFIAVVPGVVALAARRDRRLLLAAALYLTTAVVNGLHPDWTFGYGLPVRFLVTALPALALCAAEGLNSIRRSPWLGVLLCGALAVSWDAIGIALQIPELAFEGEHLPLASVAGFYPLGVHGFLPTVDRLIWVDLLVWATAALSVTAPVWRRAPRSLRGAVLPTMAIVLALLIPALWGLSEGATERLGTSVSPQLKGVTEGRIEGHTTLHSTYRNFRESNTGVRREDGTYATDRNSQMGTLVAYFMPIQPPGLYRIIARDVVAVGEQAAYVSLQRTPAALQSWTERLRFPIGVGEDGTFRFDYYHERLRFGFLHFLYDGAGALQIGETTQDFHARRLPLRLEKVARLDVSDTTGSPALPSQLAPGRYLARFHLSGGALWTLTQRQPVPVKMAVVVTDGAELPSENLQPWFESRRRMTDISTKSGAVAAQREVLAAPWWASVPVLGGDAYELSFRVRQQGLVWFLFQYYGPADLDLREVVVYRQHLDME